MATAQEIKDEYLECKICFEPFVTPKVLDCLHSFCLKCLQRIEAKAKNKHIISCPICRCETTTQKGVDGLRVNFLINSLQEAMGKMRAGPVTCEFCDDDASHKCIQCLDDMCKSHASMHTYSKFTRNHNVVPLDEVKSGKYATQIKAAQQVECETHAGKYIELFCTQCDTPVCMMCKITEHDSHKCVTIAQAAATKKEALQAKLDDVQSDADDLKGLIKDLDGNHTSLLNDEKTTTKEVAKLAEKLRSKITSQEKVLKKEIQDKAKRQTKEYEKQKRKAKNELEAMDNIIDFGKTLTTCGRDIDVVMFSKQLATTLDTKHGKASFPPIIYTCPSCKGYSSANCRDICQKQGVNCPSCNTCNALGDFTWRCQCGHRTGDCTKCFCPNCPKTSKDENCDFELKVIPVHVIWECPTCNIKRQGTQGYTGYLCSQCGNQVHQWECVCGHTQNQCNGQNGCQCASCGQIYNYRYGYGNVNLQPYIDASLTIQTGVALKLVENCDVAFGSHESFACVDTSQKQYTLKK